MVLGQNANKTMKMPYHCGNLGTLGKSHVILRDFWSKCKKLWKCTILGEILGAHCMGKNHEIVRCFGSKCKQNYENGISLGKSWVYTLGKNHEIVRGFGPEMRLKLRIQADWEDGGGGIRDDEGRGGHQALRPLQQHPPHTQDRQGQTIKRMSRRNLN